MYIPTTLCFLSHFSTLRDPRQAPKVLYPLPEVLLLMLCATIAGADDFVEIGLWANEHIDFLRRFLPYEHGIPSHEPKSGSWEDRSGPIADLSQPKVYLHPGLRRSGGNS